MLRKHSTKFNYHSNGIIKMLSEINYECYFIKDRKLVKINEILESTEPTNFFS